MSGKALQTDWSFSLSLEGQDSCVHLNEKEKLGWSETNLI